MIIDKEKAKLLHSYFASVFPIKTDGKDRTKMNSEWEKKIGIEMLREIS